jgi:hypothetical protein
MTTNEFNSCMRQTTALCHFTLQIVTDKGSHLDIRLPSITSSLTAAGEFKSPPRNLRQNTLLPGVRPMSPDSGKIVITQCDN